MYQRLSIRNLQAIEKSRITCSLLQFLNTLAGKHLEYQPKAKSKARDAYEYYTFYQEEEDIRSVG
jgi:hypothetical protein